MAFAAEGCSSLQPRSPSIIRHHQPSPGGSLAHCLAPGSAVLTGGDCARLASHYGVSVRPVAPPPPQAPGSGGGAAGEAAWRARAGTGRRGASHCGRPAGWATPHGRISVGVSSYGLGYEIARSCGILRICVSVRCVVQGRERKRGR